jgi:hypothetical protein
LIPRKGREFSLLHRVQTGSVAHLFNGYWGTFPRGLKRPGREADHSPPPNAEVRNVWSYTLLLWGNISDLRWSFQESILSEKWEPLV